MAHQLIWSPHALDDIERIAEYIARDSEFYAATVAQRLFEAPLKLLEFPRLGRIVPETNTELIRELFVHEYRLLYEIRETAVHVLAVVHGRRQFTAAMLDPEAGR